jgi:hypothetical protein
LITNRRREQTLRARHSQIGKRRNANEASTLADDANVKNTNSYKRLE